MALTEEYLASNEAFGPYPEQQSGSKRLAQHLVEKLPIDDGTPYVNGHNGIPAPIPKDIAVEKEIPRTDRSRYTIPMEEKLAFTARKLRVITIGAGFSGLLMAHKFQHRFAEMDKIVEHTIFEKRGDFGGTWLVNRYPGVQCDVPSHIYVCCTSFVNAVPRSTYSHADLKSKYRRFRLIPIPNGRGSIPVGRKSINT